MKGQDLPINAVLPRVMHIDLNSCFAIIEQQANRLLRGRPVGVAAYDTPRGFVLAASYEAKRQGIKLGVNVQEARAMCPGIVIMTPDPSKYREAHRRFKELMLEYTSDVTPKSIDEFVLDLSGSPILRSGQTMEQIGLQIKDKVRERLGEWVTVNIGIGPNRFLAKYAAGFNKPDGMTRIDHHNLERYFTCRTPQACVSLGSAQKQAGRCEACGGMDLVDLPGINTRYRARLQMYGIMTPLDFLHAERRVLEKVVFKSIVGYYWYLRLRGYEIDKFDSTRQTIGHQYALPHKTSDRNELGRLLMKLCEKVGRRLRKDGFTAGGIHLYLSFENYQGARSQDNSRPSRSDVADDFSASSGASRIHNTAREQQSRKSSDAPKYNNLTSSFAASQVVVAGRSGGFIGGDNLSSGRSWHRGQKLGYRLYSTDSVYRAAKGLLAVAAIWAKVRGMSITVFDLKPVNPEQLSFFETAEGSSLNGGRSFAAERHISDAVDTINNRYGEFVITPGTMMDMNGEILDRIAFGSVRDL